MASDLPRVTCSVSKKARIGPRQLDWVPESAFGLLWPQVLHNQKWGSEGAGQAGAGGLCPFWAPDVARAYAEEPRCLHVFRL